MASTEAGGIRSSLSTSKNVRVQPERTAGQVGELVGFRASVCQEVGGAGGRDEQAGLYGGKPIQDHLVDRVYHWPDVNGLGALLAGRPLRAPRPLHFFRPDGSMPEAAEMPLTIPPELGPAADVLTVLRERVRAMRLSVRQRGNAPAGKCVVGAPYSCDRGAVSRPAVSLGEIYDPAWRPRTSRRGSKR